MALNQETRAATAFKKLSGFINSQNGTSFFSEVVPSQISIATQEVVGQKIPDDPTNLSNKKKVQLELVKNSSSGYAAGKGYELAIPQSTSLDLPSGSVTVKDGSGGSDPLNRLVRDFRIDGGGRRSVQIISQKYNLDKVDDASPGYGYVFYSDVGNNDVISRADDSNWQVDPVAGIVTSKKDLRSNENLQTANEGEAVSGAAMEVYLFTGPTLEYRVSNLSGGGGGSTGLQDDQGPGVVVFDENASTGEKSLAYDATEVITNIDNPTSISTSTDSTGDNQDVANYDVTHDINRSVVDGWYLLKGTSGSPVTQDTYGTYNFNNNSIINVSSGTFKADGGNNTVTLSANNAKLNSNGKMKLSQGSNTSGGLSVDVNQNQADLGDGEIIAVDFTETSSMRYKTNITSAGDAILDKISNLSLKSFEYKDREGTHLGMIAEEVAQVFPELVNTDSEGRPDRLNYGKLSPVAIEAVKELKKQNDRLRERVEELENQVR